MTNSSIKQDVNKLYLQRKQREKEEQDRKRLLEKESEEVDD